MKIGIGGEGTGESQSRDGEWSFAARRVPLRGLSLGGLCVRIGIKVSATSKRIEH